MATWSLILVGLGIFLAIAAPSGVRLLLEVREDRRAAKAEAEWARRQRHPDHDQ